MKNFISGLLEFIGIVSNFLFYALQLYIFLFFVYILLYSIAPDIASLLSPLYIDIVKGSDISIQNNLSNLIIFAVFSFMLVFTRNFLILRFDNFCTFILNKFDYVGTNFNLKESFNIANKKDRYLEELRFVILVKINFDIYKSFFDEENEKTEEEIISIKKNILAQVASALSGYQIIKTAMSNDIYAAVILNINKFYEITTKLNNIKKLIPSKYASPNVKIDLTIVCDEFCEDDNFHQKVFFLNKIPNIIKKSEFVSTSNLENTFNIDPELKEKYIYQPVGTYSLSDENGVSSDYDLSIMKFKNI